MNKKQQNLLVVIALVCCVFTKVNAQQTLSINQNLANYQDSLVRLSEDIYSATNNIDRVTKNAQFVKKFIAALKINNSFKFEFDSLKRITILKSPDKSFRIITWFIPTDEGKFRYYGTIQMATNNGTLKLFPLNDKSYDIIDTNELLTSNNWFGARYYEMLPVVLNGEQPYFILLGWKGNDLKTSKKVIEVLSFNNNIPIFGKNIFETAKNGPLKNRIIFEYNKQNALTLTYNQKANMIVFDHLAPYEPNMVGNFEFYGNDSSFDGYKLVYGKLTLEENIKLNNEASIKDDLYNPPVKATKVNTRNGNLQ